MELELMEGQITKIGNQVRDVSNKLITYKEIAGLKNRVSIKHPLPPSIKNLYKLIFMEWIRI